MRALERRHHELTSWPLALRGVRVERVFEGLAVAAALFSMLGFVVAAFFRITFAYPLWIMESPTLEAMRRIANGLPVYAPPSLEYVSPIYTPVYFYASALVAHALGSELAAARLLSLLASLGSAALVAWMVWAETHRTLSTIVAAGLFVSATELSFLSLDLARVDPLCLLLLLAAIGMARIGQANPERGVWPDLASGAFAGLAVLTKQTAVAVALVLPLIALLDRRPRAVLAYLIGLGLTFGTGALLMYWQFGAWAVFYLVSLPRQHSLPLDQVGDFWTHELLPAATIPLVLAPVFFIGRALSGEKRLVRFWIITTAGMVGMAWIARLNRWSDDNVLLPAFAALAILTGLGLDEALRRLGGTNREARGFRVYALALVAVEFAVIGYNPRASAPLRSDVWSVEHMVSTTAALPGVVFAPDFPELVHLAGKGESAVGLSILELEGGFGGAAVPEGRALIDSYRAALDQRRFDALLLDPESVEFFLADQAQASGYVDTGPLFKDDDVIWLWGSHVAPKAHVWVPAERANL